MSKLSWLGQWLKRLTPEEGWFSYLLVFFLLLTVVWSVEKADWVRGLPSLTLTAFLASLLGLAFAKVRLPGLFLHPLALIMGGWVVVWQAISALEGEGLSLQWAELQARLGQWFYIARGKGISADSIPFMFLLLCLTWLVGYITSWLVFRGWGWAGLLPSLAAILVNLSFLPRSYAAFFGLYLLAALLLLAWLNFAHQKKGWGEEGVSPTPGTGTSVFTLGLLAASTLVLVGWMLPLPPKSSFLAGELERWRRPWQKFEGEFNRLFSSLSSGKPLPLHNFGAVLPFRGAVNLPSTVAFYVSSPIPDYWAGRRYDLYTPQGWVSSDTITEPLPSEADISALLPRETILIPQQMQMNFATDFVFAGGQALKVEPPAQGEKAKPMTFLVDLRESPQDSSLPPDLGKEAEELRKKLGGILPRFRPTPRVPRTPPGVEIFSPTPTPSWERLRLGDVAPLLSPEWKALSLRQEGGRVKVEVRREPAPPEDALVVRATAPIPQGARYSVQSSISIASPEDLRLAGVDYPSAISDRYLQLPPKDFFPDRVRELAKRLTREEKNPFDKAAAIEKYLRGIPYRLDIAPPPYGMDGVEYYLFTTRAGYCDYAASAMAVMLRSLGIPSRLVVGYATGDWDEKGKVYVVRETHSHAWPEVYFPDYGWIKFEPSANRPEVKRGPVQIPEEDIPLDLGYGVDPWGFEEDMPFGGIGGGSYTGSDQRGLPLIPILFPPLVFLALGGFLWYAWNRGLSQLPPPSRYYAKMSRLAALARLGPQPSFTPGEYGGWLASRFPGQAKDIEALVEGHVKAVYGKKTLPKEDVEKLSQAWRRLRIRLFRRLLPLA